MKKKFLFFPALVLSGIFAVSCSFNGASSDVSFSISLPARAVANDGIKYNYAVYVTGRAEPWRGTITRGNNNVIKLDNFPVGSGQTVYIGFLETDGIYPRGYSGQGVVNTFGAGDSVNLSVKSLQYSGEFNFPEQEETTVEILGNPIVNMPTNASSYPTINISNLPNDSISSEGELYMCSFTYQKVIYSDNNNVTGYGSENHAECPVWLAKIRPGNNAESLSCSICINNIPEPIKISNVKLRRWGEKTGHECNLCATENGANDILQYEGNVNFAW